MLSDKLAVYRLLFAALPPLFSPSLSAATLPAPLDEAMAKIHAASNYAWSVTINTPGAPFKISPYHARIDATGWLILETKTGGPTLVVVGQGSRRVVKTPSGWTSPADLLDPEGADLAAINDLLADPSPVAELDALLTEPIDLAPQPDGSFVGVIKEDIALNYITSMVASRAPGGFKPELKLHTSLIQIWIKDGLPVRYTTVLIATASLPFGKKELNRTTIVEISGFGTSPVAVPPEARQKLQPVAPSASLSLAANGRS